MPTTNAQIFRAYKLAQGLLEKGEVDFVCHALDRLEQEGDISPETADEAREHIRQRLEGYYTYGEWLENSPHTEAWERYTNGDDYTKRQCRIDWLTALMQEFSQ